MYFIILIAMAGTLLLAVWNLVYASPRSLILLVPQQLAFIAGAALLIYGIFFAFAAAVLVQNDAAMLFFLLKGHVGFYFTVVHHREDEGTVRRAFIMMGAMVATIIGIFVTHDLFAALLLMLVLLAAGYYVLTSNAPFLGRRS